MLQVVEFEVSLVTFVNDVGSGSGCGVAGLGIRTDLAARPREEPPEHPLPHPTPVNFGRSETFHKLTMSTLELRNRS